jgi:hypothetical protein
MQVYTARNPARYLFVPVEGPVVLFEYRSCEHLAAHLATIDEIRPAQTIMPLYSGHKHEGFLRAFVAEIEELVARHGVFGRRVGIEAATTGPRWRSIGPASMSSTLRSRSRRRGASRSTARST